MPTGTRECHYEVWAGDLDSDGIGIRANGISGTALGTAPLFKVDGEVTTNDIFYYIMNNPYETLLSRVSLYLDSGVGQSLRRSDPGAADRPQLGHKIPQRSKGRRTHA